MTAIIKKDGDTLSYDPMRALREWMRWDPFQEMAPLTARLDTQSWMPGFEVSEGKDAYRFKADLPGVKPEDIEIRLSGNRLEFRGKRETESETKTDTFYTCERAYGSFARSFTLPDGIDAEHIRSDMNEGVLTVVVPKKAEAQPRKIAVTAAAKKS
jgi:HSP20 family protein